MQTLAQRRLRDRKRKNDYFSDPKNRAIKQKRDRDRYHYEKKNWKIPKGKELDHWGWYWRWKLRVIPKAVNRRKWAITSAKVRRKSK